MLNNKEIQEAMTIKLDDEYPDYPEFVEGIRRAPDRGFRLTKAQAKIALKNALRYVPEELHEKLAPEFMEELKTRGRVYAYRYRPEGRIWGKPIDEYKGKCLAGKALQVMIDNNLNALCIRTSSLHTARQVPSARTGCSTGSSRNTWRSSQRIRH